MNRNRSRARQANSSRPSFLRRGSSIRYINPLCEVYRRHKVEWIDQASVPALTLLSGSSPPEKKPLSLCGGESSRPRFLGPYCKLQTSFFPFDLNRWGKNSVRNLQYGSRTQLVRGMYPYFYAGYIPLSTSFQSSPVVPSAFPP